MKAVPVLIVRGLEASEEGAADESPHPSQRLRKHSGAPHSCMFAQVYDRQVALRNTEGRTSLERFTLICSWRRLSPWQNIQRGSDCVCATMSRRMPYSQSHPARAGSSGRQNRAAAGLPSSCRQDLHADEAAALRSQEWN